MSQNNHTKQIPSKGLLSLFGIELDSGNLQDKLLAVVNALFAVLVILGIVADLPTEGLKDSQGALG